MTLTDEQIEEIKARAEAATPEPWRQEGPRVYFGYEGGISLHAAPNPINNSHFIARARTDIPLLISALEAEKKRADEAEDRAERFQDALQELQQWANAYPLNIFPEPNFSLAAKVLSDAGISLDAISASNMRHVLSRVEEITRGVLNEKETGNDAG